MTATPRSRRIGAHLFALAAAACLVAACVTHLPASVELHGWWGGLGPVLPHDSFPADCGLCHEGTGWQTIRDDFEFDHEARTGVALDGAHARAQCLRCHNDRGPVAVFAARGCAGCHEDVHEGRLGADCASCHQELDWRPVGQVERHARTRFPLVGAHLSVACHRCHLGAEVGRFLPQSVACASCHFDEASQAQNPNHLALGWTNRCERCHLPTDWRQARLAE